MNVEDMDEDSSTSEEEDDDDEEDGDKGEGPSGVGKAMKAVDAAPAVNQPPLPAPGIQELIVFHRKKFNFLSLSPGNVQVRKYDPKEASKAKKVDPTGDDYLVSPITGEKIPASKFAEHMKVGLLDPRWVDARDKQVR